MGDKTPSCQHGNTGTPQGDTGPVAFARAYAGLPLPATLNWWWTFGAVLVAVLGLMLATGLFLALTYTPDAGLAFSSVESIERRVPYGWLLRAMHMTGASFCMAALYVHILRGLYYRSYLPPRRAVWGSGCALMAMLMVTAFAGYVLPWGQMSYWGADVAGRAVATLPLVGGWLGRMVLGGENPGTATLHRMFVLHFALAFVIIGGIALHVMVLHRRGSSSPSGRLVSARDRMLPFHPYFTVRDMLAVVLVALAFVLVMGLWPELIAEPANYRPANPLHTPVDIEPEWYFLPFYGMMQVVPYQLGGVLLAGGAVAVLFAVPWLDRGGRAGEHPIVRLLALALMVVAAVMAASAGRHHAQGVWLLAGRVAIAVYYAYFLLFLPWLGGAGLPDAQDDDEKEARA
ncbi:cytochrome b N-terminal domain-containing protein [Acetobacter suratthaniensis]|uniref:Cytochrome b n=1 Tax=Acetobacter suratthaniensis TaxID=1502841 RepID=A0ABS3LHM4_9PROT|nr:cytochrome b N-terminal domain-containing protein [Acetobacter suratthaniensis]MBO1327113.1 cytochrome b N-terminal domain-containing protein [Acetobacter suratthaniensis]MCX2565276.1 cytochrome b N-terminal domain-containing protein [Acetobacter suratthaniensis]